MLLCVGCWLLALRVCRCVVVLFVGLLLCVRRSSLFVVGCCSLVDVVCCLLCVGLLVVCCRCVLLVAGCLLLSLFVVC